MRSSFFVARPLRALLGFHRTPLLSLSKEPPLHRRRFRASTPGAVLAYAFPTPSTGRYHRTDSFRSRRFSRPQRFAPHGALQVYCTLLPVMGSAWFLSTSFLSERPTEASPQLPRTENPAEAIIPALKRCPPRFQSIIRRRLPAPAEARRNDSMIIPSGASTLRSFPLHLSCAIVTTSSPCCHASPVPPNGHPFTLLLSAPFFQFPPGPFPVLAFAGFQVTSLNLKVLSRDAVRCTDMPLPAYPYPLLPWAFQTPVHRCPGIMRSHPMYIGPKPGRTLQQNPPHCRPKATLELPSFPRPPSTLTPLTTEAA